MSRYLLPSLAALLTASCILDDPYFINQGTSTVEVGSDDDDDETRADPGTSKDPEPESPIEDEPEPKPTPPPVTVGTTEILEPEAPPDEPPDEPAPDEPAPDVEPTVELTPGPSSGSDPEPAPSTSMGAPDGGLSCAADVCESSTTCGNGVLEAGEACEGNDLAGRSCYSQGFGGGRLQCSTSCVLDTSECLPGPTCERHIGSELGVVLTLDLVGHADDSNSYSCSEGGVDADDLTLSWTAPRAGCFEFTVSSDGAINTIVAVFDECSLATELACGEETGFYEDAVVRIDAVANTTYALVVDTDEPFNAAMIELDISACVPDEWVCPDSDYAGDQGCDCGCGAFDPDCADDTVDACDNCGRRDSCSNRQCADLDPNGNWRCMTGGGAR